MGMIFPIFDHQDNPVGFSGRIIGEGEPKYLNSPETLAYNKSLILYGLNWAKESIKEEDLAIFMEGYTDVISAHQHGTKNTIATCGTAITPQQLKLIQRYSKNIAFAFDQDAAGMEATFRAIELGQMADLNIQIIPIPEGKDPDDSQKVRNIMKNFPRNGFQPTIKITRDGKKISYDDLSDDCKKKIGPLPDPDRFL